MSESIITLLIIIQLTFNIGVVLIMVQMSKFQDCYAKQTIINRETIRSLLKKQDREMLLEAFEGSLEDIEEGADE